MEMRKASGIPHPSVQVLTVYGAEREVAVICRLPDR